MSNIDQLVVLTFDVHVTYPEGTVNRPHRYAQVPTTLTSIELHEVLESLIPGAEEIRVTFNE